MTNFLAIVTCLALGINTSTVGSWRPQKAAEA